MESGGRGPREGHGALSSIYFIAWAGGQKHGKGGRPCVVPARKEVTKATAKSDRNKDLEPGARRGLTSPLEVLTYQ